MFVCIFIFICVQRQMPIHAGVFTCVFDCDIPNPLVRMVPRHIKPHESRLHYGIAERRGRGCQQPVCLLDDPDLLHFGGNLLATQRGKRTFCTTFNHLRK